MKRTRELKKLFKDTMNNVFTDDGTMMAFLEQNVFLYKYPIKEIIYIHGQNPNATYVATFKQWKSLNESVKANSKAIQSVIDHSSDSSSRLSLFDISQTTAKEVNVYDWTTHETMLTKLIDAEEKTWQTDLRRYLASNYDKIKDLFFLEHNADVVPLLAEYTMAIKMNLPIDLAEVIEKIKLLSNNDRIEFFSNVDIANQVVKYSMGQLQEKHSQLVKEEKYTRLPAVVKESLIEETNPGTQNIENDYSKETSNVKSFPFLRVSLQGFVDRELHLGNSLAVLDRERGFFDNLGRIYKVVVKETAPIFDFKPNFIVETHDIDEFEKLINSLHLEDNSETEHTAALFQRELLKNGNRTGGSSIVLDMLAKHFTMAEEMENILNGNGRVSSFELADITNAEGISIYDYPSSKMRYDKEKSQMTFTNGNGNKEVFTFVEKENAPHYDVNHFEKTIITSNKEAIVNQFTVAHYASSFLFTLEKFAILEEEKIVTIQKNDSIEKELATEISLFEVPDDTADESIIKPNTVEPFNETKNTNQDLLLEKEKTTISEQAQTVSSFSFPSDDSFYPQTKREKIQGNINALKLSNQLKKEQRPATPDEQVILAKYVGWDGLPELFDTRLSTYNSERLEVRTLVTPDAYREMEESVLTAYYTDPDIIAALYSKIKSMGFTGGKILDPAMGTGNFFSAMPHDLKEKSELFGVELDSVTGQIAKQLHPTANIQVKGFEETKFNNNSFDLVVGNIPFNNFNINDKAYDKPYLIHDYFVKKALDLTHEGGIVALITSNGTLDKSNISFRSEISKTANLLGAVRLPNNAFKRIAGTEVTTDIIFLQKNTHEREVSPSWVFTGMDGKEGSVAYNNYFIENPEQVLGEIEIRNFRGGTLSVKAHTDIKLVDSLNDGFRAIEGTYEETAKALPAISIETDSKKEEEIITLPDVSLETTPQFRHVFFDDIIYFDDGDGVKPLDLPNKTAERVIGMIEIRDWLEQVIAIQENPEYSTTEFEKLLKKLNQAYDTFVKKNGYLNDSANSRAFREDDTSPLLLSIENIERDKETGKRIITKADIFKKATIKPNIVVSHANSANEALHHSILHKQKIDFDYMMSLYPKSKEEIMSELDGDIFINPDKYDTDPDGNIWETRDEYLTGNVKDKLISATHFSQKYPNIFDKNVSALEQVQPKDLQIRDIDMSVGAIWIPEDIYFDFMRETFDMKPYQEEIGIITLEYNDFNSRWFIKGKNSEKTALTTNRYGTKRANAYSIFEDSLNLKKTEVRDAVEDDDGKTTYVLNTKETMLARSKQETLEQTFHDWIFKSNERVDRLLRIYNDRFNRYVPRKYDGSNLEFNGLANGFELRPHQKNVVARIIHTGTALMGHEVGAGKSLSMIAAGMLMKEQGMVNKPLYVVPNHLTAEFGQEILRFYPSKKVLVTSKRDFQKANRQKFISRIATGDYDAIVIGQSQFERINISKERREALLRQEIAEVTDAIEKNKEQNGEGWSFKQQLLFKKKLEERLDKLMNEEIKDNHLTFEQLGVDFMFVDEAHNYKNLYNYTKLANVAGVNSSNSQRATDLFLKVQYLQETHRGRGVVFATGTPVSNSMSEIYTMQRFLQPNILREMGVSSFDEWASTFGEIVSQLEITPEGSGYHMKTRFARFHNLPELMTSFNLVADIQTQDMLDLPVPKIKTGVPINIVTDISEEQDMMMAELGERAENIRSGGVDPSEDNMLKLIGDAKKMSIDMRLIDEEFERSDSFKISHCVDNAYSIYQETAQDKGTQIIFSDTGTPKKNEFNVYDEIKTQLMEKGVNEDEIAFIHDAKNERQREEMFEKVRKGDIRIILGSTGKLGTGTNIQDRMIAGHHIDVPWRPADLTQRDGRIIRQGNQYDEVQIYRYITEGTFDAFLWQVQEQKSKFISQVMTSRSPSRSMDDVNEVSMTAGQAKAQATRNPIMAEYMELENSIDRLRLLKGAWLDEQRTLKNNIYHHYPKLIEQDKENLKLLSKDFESIQDKLTDEFSIQIDGVHYDNRKEAGAVIHSKIKNNKPMATDKLKVAEYKGLNVFVTGHTLGSYLFIIEGRSTQKTDISLTSETGTLLRLENAVKRIPERISELEKRINETQQKISLGKEEISDTFPQEEELSQSLDRKSELDLEMEKGSLEATEKRERDNLSNDSNSNDSPEQEL